MHKATLLRQAKLTESNCKQAAYPASRATLWALTNIQNLPTLRHTSRLLDLFQICPSFLLGIDAICIHISQAEA